MKNEKPIIDLDELLTGNPTPEQIVDFLENGGEFCEEGYLVTFIKRYCRDDEDRSVLAKLDISIEELLNGRFSMDHFDTVREMMNKWNKKLGTNHFHF